MIKSLIIQAAVTALGAWLGLALVLWPIFASRS